MHDAQTHDTRDDLVVEKDVCARVRPHNGGRTRRHPPLVAAVRSVIPSALVGMLLTACGTATLAGKQGHPPTSRQVSTAASPILAFAFPINSSDFSTGLMVQQFAGAVDTRTVDQCMAAKGFAAPPVPPKTTGSDPSQFPDLATIRTSGFENLAVSYIPRQPPTTSQAYDTALTNCSSHVDDPLDVTISDASTSLGAQWLRQLAAIDSSARFQAAMRTWGGCMRTSGIAVTGLSEFFTYVNRQTIEPFLDHTLSLDGARANEIRLGGIFATCMQPAETLRESMRSSARVLFFSNHNQSIIHLVLQFAAAERAIASRLHMTLVSSVNTR